MHGSTEKYATGDQEIGRGLKMGIGTAGSETELKLLGGEL